MLTTRVYSAIILGAVVLPLVWVGGPLFLAGIIALAILASWEYGRMVTGIGYQPQMPLLFGLAVTLPLAAYVRSAQPMQGEIVAAAIALSLLAQIFRKQAKHPLAEWALSLSGGLYVSLLISYFVLLRLLPNGTAWVFLLLACVWTCDSAAYLAGSNFGRHGFFTYISPKKTVEGAVGGILAGSVVALAGVPLLGFPLAHALPLGLAISMAATFGDLAESLIKRQLKVKDSGNTIPGHGGFLDRIDSLLFAAVVLYCYAAWLPRLSW